MYKQDLALNNHPAQSASLQSGCSGYDTKQSDGEAPILEI